MSFTIQINFFIYFSFIYNDYIIDIFFQSIPKYLMILFSKYVTYFYLLYNYKYKCMNQGCEGLVLSQT